jgi:hypothetical protein
MFRAFLTLLAIMLGTGTLSAQRWEAAFGAGATCAEYGTAGVQPVSTGGYIATGISHNVGLTCGDGDVYVVRTDDNGGLLWSNTYHIGAGGITRASCIRECANGDFIVAGQTGAPGSCCCNQIDIFLMRLKSDGSMIWLKSYGTSNTEDAATVIEMTTGNGGATNPGDFVVCGTSYLTDGTSRGNMIRVTAGGRLIWNKIYRFNSVNYPYPTYSATSFSDVKEDVGTSPSTIVVTGTMRLISGGAGEGLICRMAAIDGAAQPGPRSWKLSGTSTTSAALTILSGIAPGTTAGEIAVTGSIEWGTTTSAYTARFRSAGCGACLAYRYYLPSVASAGADIYETSSGTLAITGYVDQALGNLPDIMLIQVNANTLTYLATGGLNLYGSSADDRGASLHEVAASGSRTAGFIIAGRLGNKLCMIKTDASGTIPCQISSPPQSSDAQTIDIQCPIALMDSTNIWCTPPVTVDPRPWATLLCHATTRAQSGGNPAGDPRGDLSSAAVSTSAAAPGGGNTTVIPMADDASLTSYPNPVAKGSTFSLEYALARAGRITIEVVDIAGKSVFTKSGEYPSGTSRIPVGTEGWPSGSYVIKLTTDGASASQRITVLDK